MHFRGQSALDLLLGLLILLIVLSIFSGVLTRFEEVQREISIRQQLRDNLSVVATFSGYGSSFFYDTHVHPKTNSLPHSDFLYVRNNIFTRSHGFVDLDPVRGVNTPSPFHCSFLYDVNGDAVFGAYAYPADTGLPYVVDANSLTVVKYLYDANHSFVASGCFDYFSIEALP